MTKRTIPAILDCDPGHDDAIAMLLALASHELDVKGITIVAGNQVLEKTTENALKVLQVAGVECPVYAGYERPLIRHLTIAPQVHGESGLDGPILPPPRRSIEKMHGVTFIIEELRRSTEKVTLIPTGPLTNIAAALIGAPDIVDKIEEIVFMGGAVYGGNWSPAAEFNILVDPEAAKKVLETPVPKTMIGLDVTHKAFLVKEDIDRIKEIDHPVGELVIDLLDFFSIFYQERGFQGTPLHDPLAVAAVIQRDVVKTKYLPVQVECHGEYTTGATVVDLHQDTYDSSNVDVALEVDRERFVEILIGALETYK